MSFEQQHSDGQRIWSSINLHKQKWAFFKIQPLLNNTIEIPQHHTALAAQSFKGKAPMTQQGYHNIAKIHNKAARFWGNIFLNPGHHCSGACGCSFGWLSESVRLTTLWDKCQMEKSSSLQLLVFKKPTVKWSINHFLAHFAQNFNARSI